MWGYIGIWGSYSEIGQFHSLSTEGDGTLVEHVALQDVYLPRPRCA